MLASRRIRLSVLAAAASGALVVAMAGTALATDTLDRADVDCSGVDLPEEAQTVPSAAGELLASRAAGKDADEPDEDDTPSTTPAAAADDENDDATAEAATARTPSSRTPVL